MVSRAIADLLGGALLAGPVGPVDPGTGAGKAAAKGSNIPVILINAMRQAIVELDDAVLRIEKDLHIAAFNARHNDHHLFFAGLAVGGPAIFPPVTETQLTADVNDWAIDTNYTWHRIDSNAAVRVTGIVAADSGTIHIFTNYGGNNITFQDLAGASAAGNEILTGTGGDIVVAPDQSIKLWYDGDSAVWRVW